VYSRDTGRGNSREGGGGTSKHAAAQASRGPVVRSPADAASLGWGACPHRGPRAFASQTRPVLFALHTRPVCFTHSSCLLYTLVLFALHTRPVCFTIPSAPQRLGADLAEHLAAPGGLPPARRAAAARPPPPPRTNRTRRIPHPVLIGHAASLSQARAARVVATFSAGVRAAPPRERFDSRRVKSPPGLISVQS